MTRKITLAPINSAQPLTHRFHQVINDFRFVLTPAMIRTHDIDQVGISYILSGSAMIILCDSGSSA